ncbi:MAG: hypothetical protein ACFFD2_15565 [Promethearchaeota archaeon]
MKTTGKILTITGLILVFVGIVILVFNPALRGLGIIPLLIGLSLLSFGILNYFISID